VRESEKGLSEDLPTSRHSGQAQREPDRGRLAGYVLNLQQHHLDSRPGLLSAGVTFFRRNDGTEVQESAKSALF
jgi:hypothetical protein